MCVLFAAAPARRPAAILVGAALAWVLATLAATTVRELPPPPLQFLTTTAIACFSAGVVVAALAFRTQRRAPGTKTRAFLRAVSAVVLAPVLAFLVCGLTRSNGFFPIGSEGWELIFDPLSSALFAVVVAAALVLVEGCSSGGSRRRRREILLLPRLQQQSQNLLGFFAERSDLFGFQRRVLAIYSEPASRILNA